MKTKNIELHVVVAHRLVVPAKAAGKAALSGRRRALERLVRRVFRSNGGLVELVAAFGPDGRCIYER